MAEKEYIERKEAIKEFSNNGSIFVYGKQQCKAIVSRLNAIPAADVVSGRDFRDCRNELCLKCGAYTERHNGGCDGCRWRDA